MHLTVAERKNIREVVLAGATEYLIKPFTADCRVKLNNLVRKLCCRSACLSNSADVDTIVVNPLLAATLSDFRSMLNSRLTAGTQFNTDSFHPLHEVNGVMELEGGTHGKIVLSLSREAALAAMIPVAGRHPSEIDPQVLDVVRELTDAVVANARKNFGETTQTFGASEVLVGRTRCIEFPPGVTPVCIPFDAPHGSVAIQVGLDAYKPRAAEGLAVSAV